MVYSVRASVHALFLRFWVIVGLEVHYGSVLVLYGVVSARRHMTMYAGAHHGVAWPPYRRRPSPSCAYRGLSNARSMWIRPHQTRNGRRRSLNARRVCRRGGDKPRAGVSPGVTTRCLTHRGWRRAAGAAWHLCSAGGVLATKLRCDNGRTMALINIHIPAAAHHDVINGCVGAATRVVVTVLRWRQPAVLPYVYIAHSTTCVLVLDIRYCCGGPRIAWRFNIQQFPDMTF